MLSNLRRRPLHSPGALVAAAAAEAVEHTSAAVPPILAAAHVSRAEELALQAVISVAVVSVVVDSVRALFPV